MSESRRLWTYRDLQSLPSDGHRYEVVDGDLVVTPSPGLPHQRASIHLAATLYRAIEETGTGKVFHAPFDVIFSDIRVVIPDLLVVKRERWHIIKDRGIEGAPDLIVEILSPTTIKTDRELKRRLYATVAVPEYWIVNPTLREIEVLARHDGDLVLVARVEHGLELRSPTLGIAFPVDAIFAP